MSLVKNSIFSKINKKYITKKIILKKKISKKIIFLDFVLDFFYV